MFGETTYPHEARAFVRRGLIGAAVVPLFAAFCEVFLQTRIEPDAWGYIIAGGYTAGSLGIEIMIQQEKAERAKNAPVLIEPLQPSPTSTQSGARKVEEPAQPEAKPFRYAEWDHAEELK